MFDLSKNHIGVRRPLERFGICIVGADVILDSFFEFFDATKDASADDFISYFCEPELHLVEP